MFRSVPVYLFTDDALKHCIEEGFVHDKDKDGDDALRSDAL